MTGGNGEGSEPQHTPDRPDAQAPEPAPPVGDGSEIPVGDASASPLGDASAAGDVSTDPVGGTSVPSPAEGAPAAPVGDGSELPVGDALAPSAGDASADRAEGASADPAGDGPESPEGDVSPDAVAASERLRPEDVPTTVLPKLAPPDSVVPVAEPPAPNPAQDASADPADDAPAPPVGGTPPNAVAASERLRPEDVPTTVLPKLTPPVDAVPPTESPAPNSAVPPATTPGPAPSPPVPDAAPAADVPGPDATRPRRRIVVGAIAGVVVAGAALYVADLAMSSDRVPRGVSVAGVDVGGMSHAAAETTLRAAIEPRAQQPVPVRAGDVTTEVVPAAAGLGVDWAATLDRAGSQPLNPITRLTSLFTHRDVGVAATRDEAALAAAVEGLRPRTDRAPVEGTVVFEGATPVAVSPRQGQVLDAAGAQDALAAGWAETGGVEVPVTLEPVTVTPTGVDRALRDVAAPAASADLVVTGRDGSKAVLGRDRVGTVLSFTPDGTGGLIPRFDPDAAIAVLAPQLAGTETKPKDASFRLSGGAPTVVPATVGEMVEWHKTLESLPAVLSGSGPRTVAAVYEPKQPELTTEAARKLGITEVIGEYTTGGFEYASGVNIRLAASEIDGALVKPGDTFSLNGYTGPRGAAQGYVESGIINNGRPGKAVGGGISQLATTLYNAAYFAGMEDAGHTEHSYYISRYPAAREATVFEGAIDLQFRNPGPTGVLIETIGTGSDITVRLWGTKRVEVESVAGDRYAHTSPNTVTLPKGPGCVPSGGAQGFTTSDTRIVTDHVTGQEISRHTRTVKYDPVPIVKCE
ncbi:VanW family protein [Rhodococcus olei]